MRLIYFCVIVLGTASAQRVADRNTSRSVSLGEATFTSRAATRQIARGNTDERISTYERLIKSEADNQKYRTGLIGAYLQKVRETSDPNYLDRASRLVDAMLAKDGSDFAALRYQNEIDLQRHNFKAVELRAETMVKDAPSDPGSWGNLGDAAMELGEYENAGRAYVKMFSLGPNLGSYNRLAFWRFVTGDSETAIDLMNRAIEAGDEQTENIAWCLAELGDMHFKLGRLIEAEESYRSALDLFPRLHRALGGIGKVQAARGDVRGAIKSYEQAQAIVPLVDYAGALEDLYSSAGLREKAASQRELITAVEKLGMASNERTNRNLALVLADHNRDLDLALDLVTAELPSRGDVYTWDAFSWVLFKKGRTSEAKAASANALKMQTPEPLFYYHAREIAAASGDMNATQSFAKRLAALNTTFNGPRVSNQSGQNQ